MNLSCPVDLLGDSISFHLESCCYHRIAENAWILDVTNGFINQLSGLSKVTLLLLFFFHDIFLFRGLGIACCQWCCTIYLQILDWFKLKEFADIDLQVAYKFQHLFEN